MESNERYTYQHKHKYNNKRKYYQHKHKYNNKRKYIDIVIVTL